jgi:hypothetical protein
VAFVGDYMVIAESAKIADGIAADVEDSALADDSGYQKWVDEAGGDGIFTAYVAPDGVRAVLDTMGGPELPTGVLSGDGGELTKAFEDFQGGALVARFEDESLKVELAAGGLPSKVRTGGHSGLTELPATTALALGVGIGDTFADDLVSNLRDALGDEAVDQMIQQAETETGLSLPEDLQALLGDGVSVGLDSSLDAGAFFGGSSGSAPSDFPMGVRISGDSATIMPPLVKLLSATGAGDQGVVVEQRDGAVAIGVSRDYVKTLADDGGLGDQERFDATLPDLPESAGALYVDFDAGDWLTSMVESAPDSEELEANAEPLSTLGITGGMDGDTVHVVLRLSTD